MTSSGLKYIDENIAELQKKDQVVGYYLYGADGEAIARVEAVLVESGTYLCRYIVIRMGGFLKIEGKKIILPIETCEVADLGKVKTEWRKESIMDAPNPVDLLNVTMEEEELILGYFDLEPYWAAKPASGGSSDA
ncbi:MAG: PRC-barrel domain-containing protein [Nitrospinaceae bacterium]|jgi:hypothetical protein|nr:MAG: PRC-barrel domain-containing protein [Nitrospinaceae bacterium]